MIKDKEEKTNDKEKKRDSVELASDESFPASDPPAWTGVTVGKRADRENKGKGQ